MNTGLNATSVHFRADTPQPAESLHSPALSSETSDSEPSFRSLGVSAPSRDWQTARGIVSEVLDRFRQDQPLPEEIARFFAQYWESYLAILYQKEGVEGRGWLQALEDTAALIWSVQPKRHAGSRKRLVQMLPTLQQRLYVGLESIGVGIREVNAFFAELSRLQQASLNAQQRIFHRAPWSEPLDAPSVAKIARCACDSARDEGNAAETPVPSLQGAQPDADATAPRTAGSDGVAGLRVGAHVLFRDGSEAAQVMRLTWISSSGRVFLFKDLRANHELTITTSRLRQRFEDHSAAPM